MSETYTSKITRNSAWATFSFMIVSICNFAISVVITRYFGKDVYGQYSYFLWLSTTLALVAGFGFQQTVLKFLPKHFFPEKENAQGGPSKTTFLFRKIFLIQIIGSIIITALCIGGVQFFEHLINFSSPQKTLLFVITFISIIPLSINTLLNSSFSALQEFQKLSRTNMGVGFLNLAAILLFVFTQQNISSFLWLYLGVNTVSFAIMSWQIWHILPATGLPEKHLDKGLFSYSFFAYIGILCSQIVWERSEILFLGLFSDSSQIALYTLSYSLAVLFIYAWGPINGVLNATTAEVVLTGKKDTLMMITQHGTKYLAILMLPLCLIASLFLKDVVMIVYGKSFQDVALLFPFLVISHVIAVITSPAGNMPLLTHEVKKSMVFSISTAILNIILDFYLISRYQAVGAMLANSISQFFAIGLVLINAKKYRLGIFNKYTVRVFVINAFLTAIFFFIFPFDFFTRLMVAIIAMIIYTAAIIKTSFNHHDIRILKNLQETMPRAFKSTFAWFVQMIEKSI